VTTIDFTKWTDAQLAVGAKFTSSPNYPALAAEIARRQAAGLDDGSQQRVADMIASNRGLQPRIRRIRIPRY
jgi:hypothetical protein